MESFEIKTIVEDILTNHCFIPTLEVGVYFSIIDEFAERFLLVKYIVDYLRCQGFSEKVYKRFINLSGYNNGNIKTFAIAKSELSTNLQYFAEYKQEAFDVIVHALQEYGVCNVSKQQIQQIFFDVLARRLEFEGVNLNAGCKDIIVEYFTSEELTRFLAMGKSGQQLILNSTKKNPKIKKYHKAKQQQEKDENTKKKLDELLMAEMLKFNREYKQKNKDMSYLQKYVNKTAKKIVSLKKIVFASDPKGTFNEFLTSYYCSRDEMVGLQSEFMEYVVSHNPKLYAIIKNANYRIDVDDIMLKIFDKVDKKMFNKLSTYKSQAITLNNIAKEKGLEKTLNKNITK